MNMNPKAYGYLSLARRARNLEVGEEPVGALCRANRARLVLLASDAGGHTVRRAKSFVYGTNQPILQLPCTKAELGSAIGCSVCAIAALTDVRLAHAFVLSLDDADAALLAELAVRAERAAQRQKEEKAHRSNRGKKK